MKISWVNHSETLILLIKRHRLIILLNLDFALHFFNALEIPFPHNDQQFIVWFVFTTKSNENDWNISNSADHNSTNINGWEKRNSWDELDIHIQILIAEEIVKNYKSSGKLADNCDTVNKKKVKSFVVKWKKVVGEKLFQWEIKNDNCFLVKLNSQLPWWTCNLLSKITKKFNDILFNFNTSSFIANNFPCQLCSWLFHNSTNWWLSQQQFFMFYKKNDTKFHKYLTT